MYALYGGGDPGLIDSRTSIGVLGNHESIEALYMHSKLSKDKDRLHETS